MSLYLSMCISQHVFLDFDLCFSEVLDMDIRNYLSCKRSRKEVDDSDSDRDRDRDRDIFVHAYNYTRTLKL